MNKGHWTKDASFTDGFIGPNNAVCTSIVDDELSVKGISRGIVAVFYDGKWLDGGNFNWDVVAIRRCLVPFPQYVAVGLQGKVQFVGGGDIHEETIEDEKWSLLNLGQIRNANSVNGYLYVCGMNRQVYKRVDAHNWKFISADLAPENGVFGFEAIDGFSENELYAVGWEGEIWQYDGISWQKRSSGTNAILIDVVCGGDNNVYAISRDRKLIVGRNHSWQIVQLNIPADILSIACVENRLYACSSNQLFEWNGMTLFPVAMDGDCPGEITRINASEGKLCVVGPKDLFIYYDKLWVRVD